MRNIFFVLIALLMIIACSSSDNQSNKTEEITSPPPPAKVPGDLKTEKELSAQESNDKGRLVEVQMLDVGENYVYEPADLTFKVGEKITFKITSETEFHTFTIDELDLYETADAGESYEFTITFETAGTYKLYCVPHETLGMIGEVTVQ
jgi:plastocyanin|tara:strand:+ start:494 stop:940 length:447 start_codon:yes stop_codon:yes gene_type:complete